MAEAKTKVNDASVFEFLDRQPEPRRSDGLEVVEMMKKATGEEPKMWGPSIVGFGKYRYRYESGREGEWPIIGFSPRKTDLTLYIIPGFSRYEELLSRLGKHKTGKSCLYVKKLADLDRAVLAELITDSVAAMASKRV